MSEVRKLAKSFMKASQTFINQQDRMAKAQKVPGFGRMRAALPAYKRAERKYEEAYSDLETALQK